MEQEPKPTIYFHLPRKDPDENNESTLRRNEGAKEIHNRYQHYYKFPVRLFGGTN